MLKFYIFFTSLFLIALLFILVSNSKNIINKIIIANASTSLVSALIVLLGLFYKESSYIDIAIIYSLLGFAVSTAILFYASDKKIYKKNH